VNRVLRWTAQHRVGVLVTVVVLAVLVVLTALTSRQADYPGALDPQNNRRDGAQAVARVLDRHGVEVTVVRRAADLEQARIDQGTTLVVTSTENLGRRTASRLDVRSRAAGDLVVATPSPTVMRVLRLPLKEERVRRDTTAAGCDDVALRDLRVDAGVSLAYRARPGAPATSCFPADGSEPHSLVVRLDRAVPTYVVGGVSLLTNGRVTRADNAAAALRLLGQQGRVVWYVPDVRDIAAGDTGSLSAQLPGGLVGALVLAAFTVLALMVWRGRRLGALVTEPLPVVVKAAESTQGRGRLYRKVRDRGHVAGVLRRATRARLATRLRLPRDVDDHALVLAVSGATGRDPYAVHDLLLTRPVPDDAAMTRLATDLAALEREVHHP
jgi:hypothetical protein